MLLRDRVADSVPYFVFGRSAVLCSLGGRRANIFTVIRRLYDDT